MKRLQLIQRVRAMTRDFSNSIFREQDIIDFLNESINRFIQVISELGSIPSLLSKDQEVSLIPEAYQHLLAVYSTSRCFGQDERHYQATTLMNEFEVKLEEFKQAIVNGDVTILDPVTGLPIEVGMNSIDYVDMKPYWGERRLRNDFDVVGDI